VAGGVGEQEQHVLGDVLRPRDAPQRDAEPMAREVAAKPP
jgi:hypothetical protein